MEEDQFADSSDPQEISTSIGLGSHYRFVYAQFNKCVTQSLIMHVACNTSSILPNLTIFLKVLSYPINVFKCIENCQNKLNVLPQTTSAGRSSLHLLLDLKGCVTTHIWTRLWSKQINSKLHQICGKNKLHKQSTTAWGIIHYNWLSFITIHIYW